MTKETLSAPFWKDWKLWPRLWMTLLMLPVLWTTFAMIIVLGGFILIVLFVIYPLPHIWWGMCGVQRSRPATERK